MNAEFFEALTMLEKEKGISKAYMLEKVKAAIMSAIKKEAGGAVAETFDAEFDETSGKVRFFIKKDVVETVENPNTQISLEDAKKLSRRYEIGDVAEVDVETKNFGRIAAKVGKNVIIQAINEAVYGSLAQEFADKQGEIVTGIVVRIDSMTKEAVLEFSNGRYELPLPLKEQIPGEIIREGAHLKVYVVEVRRRENQKGRSVNEVVISRTHHGLVRRLFELEVPEIADGTVEVLSIAREAGSRTKIAVMSRDENVDPIGACIGPRRARINNILNELKGEKIDIIKYSENTAQYIAAALSPASVIEVEVDEDNRSCHVTVPADQLSLAIGKEGQNARLAAKLTGYKIDIRAQGADTAQ